MSNEEKEVVEIAKRHAAEVVADALKISDKTRIETSVKNAYKIGAAIIIATATICTFLNRMNNSQARIEAAIAYKVPEAQLVAAFSALDRANRLVENKDGTLGLTVPDPTLFRPKPPIEDPAPASH